MSVMMDIKKCTLEEVNHLQDISYKTFNETFKDGLEKIFSFCCRHMNRSINEMGYNQSNIPISETILKKHQKGLSGSKSNSFQLSLHKYSNNGVSIRPST